MRKARQIWVVIADGAQARFLTPNKALDGFSPAGPAEIHSRKATRRASDLKSDRPGRSFNSSRGGLRHAIEPRHDYHKLEKHKFTAAVADVLQRAQSERAFDDLIVVAPRRSLGELRMLLSPQVRDHVREEVAKDLLKSPPDEVLSRLRPIVERLALRTRRAVKRPAIQG